MRFGRRRLDAVGKIQSLGVAREIVSSFREGLVEAVLPVARETLSFWLAKAAARSEPACDVLNGRQDRLVRVAPIRERLLGEKALQVRLKRVLVDVVLR